MKYIRISAIILLILSLILNYSCKKDNLTTPSITTLSISEITQTSAISGGNITSDGGANITVRGVCISTTAGPTTELSTKTFDGTGTGTFISTLTGLTVGTVYYARAYATNSVGTTYGNEISFTTNPIVDAWRKIPSGTTNDLLYVDFLDSQTGFALGSYGTILKTTNAGENWILQSPWTTDFFTSISLINNTGYLAGTNFDHVYPRGSIYKSIDGGKTWIRQIKVNGYIYSVSFIDVNKGYAAGYDSVGNGFILRTINGGTSWITNTLRTDQNAGHSLYFTNPDVGYCVGFDGIIIKTVDAGVTWERQISGISRIWLLSLYFNNPQTGYVVGDATILKTVNGGTTWTIQNLDTINIPQTFRRSATYTSVFFTDDNNGYIVGYNDDITKKEIILKTIDGGVNWKILFNEEQGRLKSVYFTNSQTGFVVGNNGTILKTTSGGE